MLTTNCLEMEIQERVSQPYSPFSPRRNRGESWADHNARNTASEDSSIFLSKRKLIKNVSGIQSSSKDTLGEISI